MPLEKSEIRVPFGGGIDTKTDHKNVIPGKLLELKNGVFHELKQITKRNGFLTPYALTTVGWYAHGYDTIHEGSAIYRRGDELLITAKQRYSNQAITSYDDGWYMYSHDPDNNEWKNIGTRQPLRLGVETITEATAQWQIPDVAIAGNFTGYAWLGLKDPADATTERKGHLSIIDNVNNATLIDNWDTSVTLVTPIEGVHIVGLETATPTFHMWVAVPSVGNAYVGVTPTDDLAFPGPAQLKITDLDDVLVWDVCTATLPGTGPCSVVAYREDVAGHIRVRWFSEDGTLVLTRPIADVPKNAITVFEAFDDQEGENKVVVAWQRDIDGEIVGWTFNADGTDYAGTYVIHNVDLADRVRNITGCRDTASDAYVADSSFCRFYTEVAIDNANTRPDSCRILQDIIEFDGTNRSGENTMLRCCLGSKAWEYEDKARVWVVHDSYGLLDAVPDPDLVNPEIQNTYFLRSNQGNFQPWAATGEDRTDARCLGGEAGGQSFSQSLSGVVSPQTGDYLFAGLRKDVIIRTPDLPENTWDSVVGITTSFGEVAQPSTELGPTIQTGGGFIGEADGRFQENNFHLYPESLIATVTPIGGVAVDWQYCVVYEWTDREGQIHRSQPSIPIEVSCDDQDTVAIEVACLHQGDPLRLSRVRCVLYRTVDGPGSVFYRLPDIVNEYNNIDATSVTLTDTGGAPRAFTDAYLSQLATIYTGSLISGVWGVVGNICPPASSIMNVRQDRVFLVPDEDRTNIWFSKIKQHGVAVSFSDLFTKRVSDGGDITGLVTMDTREIVFKEAEIRAFSGSGPLDTGAGSFGEDYQITADVGCTDRASVCWTDKGILFKSLKGIYMLGRNLQVNYIGAPVEAYNNYKVLKAELLEDKNQVRFLLEEQNMLVYDYLVNQWSVFEAPQGEGFFPWDTVDSAIWQNTYVMIKEDGTVYREGVTWVDGVGSYIPLDFTTSWIKLSGLQGFQRIWWISLLGEVYGECNLTVELSYNYVDVVEQTVTLAVDATLTPPAQFRIKPRIQKCEAVRIRVYDELMAGWVGTQQGFSLSDIMLQIGKKPGVMRQAAEKSR